MGRRKGQIAAMAGSQLVKDKHRRSGHRGGGNDSFLHTTDLNDGADYNRINFQSVTEQNNLEEFLTTAEMAGRDFTAERQNIQVISNPGQGIKLTDEDMVKIAEAQTTHKALLQIPRRPHWDELTTKEELIMMERDSFTDWRRQLKILEEKDHIQMTPFEKNLDFWRQLWRVIERSDVIVQIVDARNPLLFRCEDLEAYVKEVDPDKTCMLLINKADYLNAKQRQQWVEFFNKEGITAVFFSAKTEKEKQEGSAVVPERERRIEEVDYYDTEEELSEDESGDDEDDDDGDVEVGEPEFSSTTVEAHDTEQMEKDTAKLSLDSEERGERLSGPNDCDVSEVDSTRADNQKSNIPDSSNSDGTANLSQNETSSKTDAPGSESPLESDQNDSASCPCQPSASTGAVQNSTSTIQNSSAIVTAEELLNIFRHLAGPASRKGSREVQTIGMVGYPNVGKSSTINVILEEKKLAVSATPGRTKHLQTLYVDPCLVLCDCPGLVFPSFVSTKAHLVINGILPIDELRDHVPPVSLVCDYIPRQVLEATYSIMIPRPSVDDDASRPPTAEELLMSYGAMRGFMTPRGVADAPRAARYILKDFVKGKLLYCEAPPGLSGTEFQDTERHQQLVDARPVSKMPPPQIASDIDKEFFSKKQSKAHSRGVGGVADFVRTDTLQHSSRATDSPGTLGSLGAGRAGSVASLDSQTSTAAGGGKSWKKHNNRNKKEKLRRIHRDLDV
ncbi:large subunit GTPase 1 homolog [Aplysia californica]|uniref:Large subunit GTPase 1 homolog n=1 Tax=Aplysia californica TaxID=6500 RepID=A0ABM1ACB5_APLCA|nr:large subunit GTPase 1 homolog [Aplysia californica]